MIKKQNGAKQDNSQELHVQSAGVGDYFADPQREVVEWAAVYFQGKFYLSDPYSIAKLQEIQSEIDLQKKLAEQFRNTDDAYKAESQRSFENHRDISSYSCATEKSPEKMRLNQLRAEKELLKEEEAYFGKLVELKNKRKQLEVKKANKNLISVKQQDTKSMKEKRLRKPSNHSQAIEKESPNHQMPNPITPLQNKQGSQPNEMPKLLQKQSLVQINMQNTQHPPHNNTGQVLQQPKGRDEVQKLKVTKQSRISKAASQHPQPNLQLWQSPTNVKHNKQEFIKSDSQHLEQTQSVILRKIQTVSPAVGIKAINILDFNNACDDEENNLQIAQQRAGNSFFNEIHSQLYKLQHNINNMQKTPQPNPPEVSSVQYQRHRREPYRPSQLLQNTKDILQEINEGLRQLDQAEHQKQSIMNILNKDNQADIKEQKMQQLQGDIHLADLKEQQQAKTGEQPVEQKAQIQTKQVAILVEPQKPKKKLLFAYNIVNYQIAESTRQSSEAHQSEQRQKLQKEISVLQQVVNQLRVERIKYQVSQNSRLLDQPQDRTIFSVAEVKNSNRNLLRLAQTPPLKKLDWASHFNVTSPNPFSQSAVSEFQNASSLTKYKLQRSKSGKIVKNNLTQTKMSKIQEEMIGETHAEQKKNQTQGYIPKLQSVQKQKSSTNLPLEAVESMQIEKNENESKGANQEPQIVIRSQPKIERKVQIAKKQQAKEHSFKIKTIISNQKLPVNSTPNNYSSAATQRPIPLTHKNLGHEPEMESSMPRTLPSHNNHSNPPKIKPAQHQENLKRREKSLNKELLDNFQQIRKKQPKNTSLPLEAVDPKRRASRECLLKNIEYKTASNPIVEDKTSNLKRKIYQIQQQRRIVPNPHAAKDQSKARNFRTRRESQSVRNSRASLTNKSSKSCGIDNKHKKPQNTVYVPALNQPSIAHPLSPKEETIYEAKFNNGSEKSANNSNYDVQKRKKAFTNIKIPIIPEPPNPNTTVQSMVLLIKELGNAVNIQFKDQELHRLIMKKYKNCIILDLPGDTNGKIVWHYNGKLYLGGWDEEAMEKNGEGFEYIPEKFYYKGQFSNNKRHGYGIMMLFNGTRYEGQWLEGEKHGRGKYQDKSIGLYYQGQWVEGKRNGIGYLQVQGQSIYEGSFETNYRTGFGSQRFSNSDFYKGEYKMGKFHGKGIYIWASGASFEGDFYEGLKHGQGKWKSGTGDLYIGEFQQDKKQGMGRFVWENGCIYDGEFAQDKKQGKGTLKYSDGRQVQGIWKDGQMIESLLVKEQDRQEPLAYRKGQKFQTITILKGGDQSAKKTSIAGKISNF